ncbi:MAG: universal stress protein [Nevskia sp.]|nr:universal stress protein [Nevskia sp.]
MKKLQSIMVVMPFERRLTPAVHRAVAYARQANAALHLRVFDHYGPIDYAKSVFGAEVSERARRDFLDERMQWLSQQAAALADQGLRVECDVTWAPVPHEAVIGATLDVRADLVVKDVDCDAAGGGALRPGAVDWKLLRMSPAPLMLVHPQARLLPQRVMAAVDVQVAGPAAALNDAVVDAARDFAGLSGAELDLGSVFSFVPIEPYGTGFIADTYEIMDNGHRDALRKFASSHGVAPAHTRRCASFDSADGIAACVRDCQADMVVLGSAYHSGLDRIMFGTTAEALLRRLACDVLLIKPEGFLDELARHLDLSALVKQGA